MPLISCMKPPLPYSVDFEGPTGIGTPQCLGGDTDIMEKDSKAAAISIRERHCTTVCTYMGNVKGSRKLRSDSEQVGALV